MDLRKAERAILIEAGKEDKRSITVKRELLTRCSECQHLRVENSAEAEDKGTVLLSCYPRMFLI
ncbi:MAG: hypothetical protein MJ142_01255 [Clostridia bacterium]|nr:hypothetical protein [Clostridia bacterium]